MLRTICEGDVETPLMHPAHRWTSQLDVALPSFKSASLKYWFTGTQVKGQTDMADSPRETHTFNTQLGFHWFTNKHFGGTSHKIMVSIQLPKYHVRF